MPSGKMASNRLRNSLTSKPTQLLGLTSSRLHLLHMRCTLHTLPHLINDLNRLHLLHMRYRPHLLHHTSQQAPSNSLNSLNLLHMRYPHIVQATQSLPLQADYQPQAALKIM